MNPAKARTATAGIRSAFFINCSVLLSAASARTGLTTDLRAASGVAAAANDADGAQVGAGADGLCLFEVHERPAVVEDRAKLGVLRIRQIPLRLHDLEVGGHPDLVLALRRLEA